MGAICFRAVGLNVNGLDEGGIQPIDDFILLWAKGKSKVRDL